MKTNFTKRLIIIMIAIMGVRGAALAQYAYNQPAYIASSAGIQNFYYYPDANVYYNISLGQYIYNNGYGWITVNTLPGGIAIGNAPRYMVYHRGPQVWMDNSIHRRDYRPVYNRPAVADNRFYERSGFDRRISGGWHSRR